IDRELLDLVDDLAAAVVAPTRIALCVLVRRHRAGRLEHGRPREVLGGDQLDLAALTVELAADQVSELGIDLCEAGRPELVERLRRADRHPAPPSSPEATTRRAHQRLGPWPGRQGRRPRGARAPRGP